MSKRRVVITGIGIVSPFGIGVDVFWESLLAGKSGIGPLTRVNKDDHIVRFAGEVPDFDEAQYIDPKESKKMDRFNRYAMVAAEDAITDAGIKNSDIDPYRFGVIAGSAAGGFETFEKSFITMQQRGYSKCSPFTIPMIISDMAAGRISIKYGAKGLNKAVVTACATSAHSIGDAFRSIQWDDADIIAAGGAEATICNIGLGAFTAARTLSRRNDEPQKASRPYDKDRDGFVMSEGAGILILEELEHAKRRGAKIYAEIVGYGQTADAYDIVAPSPDGEGAAKAMEIAVKDAGLKPTDVQYINSHGTSTGLGDIAESNAIARVFGDLSKNDKLMVSSTKSMTGHMLGAAGAVEAIVCIKSILESAVPPTINLENQDEEVANLDYVPNKTRKATVDCALTNSFGFGGHNASLLFKKYK